MQSEIALEKPYTVPSHFYWYKIIVICLHHRHQESLKCKWYSIS